MISSPSTPVVLIIYNRPDTTARVFEAVRQARPSHLLVIADGPRADKQGDAALCAATRAVVDQVDWDCTVLTNYADTNLAIKQRIESGMAWVFSQVEEAIILEDDCLPHPSFFRYCTELLDRYRHHDHVMAISGNNFLFGQYDPPQSYYFSRYPLVWGWATWRRAWQHYDPAMRRWPEVRTRHWLSRTLASPPAERYWSYIFQRTYETQDTWDYAWTFSCWLHNGLTITPAVNLVHNLGFQADATHTLDPHSQFAHLPLNEMPFPLRHPPAIRRDGEADDITEQTTFSGEHFLKPMFAATRAHLRTHREGPI